PGNRDGRNRCGCSPWCRRAFGFGKSRRPGWPRPADCWWHRTRPATAPFRSSSSACPCPPRGRRSWWSAGWRRSRARPDSGRGDPRIEGGGGGIPTCWRWRGCWRCCRGPFAEPACRWRRCEGLETWGLLFLGADARQFGGRGLIEVGVEDLDRTLEQIEVALERDQVGFGLNGVHIRRLQCARLQAGAVGRMHVGGGGGKISVSYGGELGGGGGFDQADLACQRAIHRDGAVGADRGRTAGQYDRAQLALGVHAQNGIALRRFEHTLGALLEVAGAGVDHPGGGLNLKKTWALERDIEGVAGGLERAGGEVQLLPGEDAELVDGGIERSLLGVGAGGIEGFIELGLALVARRVDVGEVVGEDVERLRARNERRAGGVYAALHVWLRDGSGNGYARRGP